MEGGVFYLERRYVTVKCMYICTIVHGTLAHTANIHFCDEARSQDEIFYFCIYYCSNYTVYACIKEGTKVCLHTLTESKYISQKPCDIYRMSVSMDIFISPPSFPLYEDGSLEIFLRYFINQGEYSPQYIYVYTCTCIASRYTDIYIMKARKNAGRRREGQLHYQSDDCNRNTYRSHNM